MIYQIPAFTSGKNEKEIYQLVPSPIGKWEEKFTSWYRPQMVNDEKNLPVSTVPDW